MKTAAPHYDVWARDVFDILEATHLDWCIWASALQPRDPINQSFDINKEKTQTYEFFASLFKSLTLQTSPADPPK